MSNLQALKFTLHILHCLKNTKLDKDRASVMAYIESSYIITSQEKESIQYWVEQYCPKDLS